MVLKIFTKIHDLYSFSQYLKISEENIRDFLHYHTYT